MIRLHQAVLVAFLTLVVSTAAFGQDAAPWFVGQWRLDGRTTAAWDDDPSAALGDEYSGVELAIADDASWAMALHAETSSAAWGTWEQVDDEHLRLTPAEEGGEPFVVQVTQREGRMALQLTEQGHIWAMSRAEGDLLDPPSTPCDEPFVAHTASRDGIVGTWVFDYVRSTEAATTALPPAQRRMAARIASATTGQMTIYADGTLAWAMDGPNGRVSGESTWRVMNVDGPRMQVDLGDPDGTTAAWFDFVSPNCMATWRTSADPHLFLWRR